MDTHSAEWLAQTEAREWLARIRAKKPATLEEGIQLLDDLIASIAKKRGTAAAQELRRLIDIERAKK